MWTSNRYRWVISAASVLVVLGALGFGRFGYTVMLPSMQEGLSLSTSQTGDLAAGNMVGYLMLSVLGGVLASRFGATRVIVVSLFLVGGSMVLTGVARKYDLALIGRILTGIGAGGANVPIMGLLAAWFSRERRGLASGIAVSGSSFGILFTGLVLPGVIARGGESGWRIGWFIFAAAVGIISMLALLLLRDAPKQTASRAFGEGASDTEEAKPTAKPTTKPTPEEWRSLFRHRSLWIYSMIYFAFGFSYVIYATFFAKALISHGMSPQSAGRLWSTVGAASIASGFIWGIISDRIGRRLTLSSIYLLQGVSFFAFGLQVYVGEGLGGIVVSIILFSLTAFSIPAVMSAAAADSVGPRLASAAFGVITLFFGFGQILGPFTAGRVIEASGGYGSSFLLAAGIAMIGSIASFVFISKPGVRAGRVNSHRA